MTPGSTWRDLKGMPGDHKPSVSAAEVAAALTEHAQFVDAHAAELATPADEIEARLAEIKRRAEPEGTRHGD